MKQFKPTDEQLKDLENYLINKIAERLSKKINKLIKKGKIRETGGFQTNFDNIK